MKLFDEPPRGMIPPLYKYVSLADEEQVERARQIVLGNVIYFSSPVQFNDPQESHFNVSFDGPLDSLQAHYRKIVERERPEWLSEEVIACADKMSRDQRLRLEMEVIARRSIRNEIRSKYAMLCLCAVNDGGLMWSHYADGHRGICIEFDIDADVEWRRRTRKVEYGGAIPEFNWFNSSDNEKWAATLLTKNQDWSYEAEWRVIDIENGRGRRKLESGMVKSVILGAEISPVRERMVRAWVESTGVRLKGASHHWTAYGVSIAENPPFRDDEHDDDESTDDLAA